MNVHVCLAIEVDIFFTLINFIGGFIKLEKNVPLLISFVISAGEN